MGTAFGVDTDGTPTNGANPWIDALVWGTAWDDSDGGTVTISYAPVNSSMGWTSAETNALNRALSAWEKVANIDFVQSSAGSADVQMWKLTDKQAQSIHPGLLGVSEVPDPSAVEPLFFGVNGQHSTWTNGLFKGGLGYVTLIHELGHLLGLAHPHDGGDAWDATTFPGVSGRKDMGTYQLNQGIFTTMSYIDGWESRYPDHREVNYGWQATPMALDVAAIQAIYGANMNAATGDDVYQLPGSYGRGTYWECIWDAGGTDRIRYGGSKDCRIDLREAPLTGPNAGGYVSYVEGVIGGFTIANGVTIERAYGGKGDDIIKGNSAGNVLSGRAGSDKIKGYGGDDLLKGGSGTDRLYGGSGNDTLVMSKGNDVLKGGSGTDTVVVSGGRGVKIDLLKTGAQNTGIGTQKFSSVENLIGTNKGDRLKGNADSNELVGKAGSDKLYGRGGHDVLDGGAGKDRLYGGSGNDNLDGGSANDRIFGGSGNDTINGGSGLDYLVGGSGADTFEFSALSHSGTGGQRDVIRDFSHGADVIDLSQIDADTTIVGNQSFVFGDMTATANGVWYERNGADAIVFMDVDGDGVADSEIELLGVGTLSAADFLL